MLGKNAVVYLHTLCTPVESIRTALQPEDSRVKARLN